MRQCATANALIRLTLGPWWKFRGVFFTWHSPNTIIMAWLGPVDKQGFGLYKRKRCFVPLWRTHARGRGDTSSHRSRSFRKADWNIQKYKKKTQVDFTFRVKQWCDGRREHFLVVVVLCYPNRTSTSQSLQFQLFCFCGIHGLFPAFVRCSDIMWNIATARMKSIPEALCFEPVDRAASRLGSFGLRLESSFVEPSVSPLRFSSLIRSVDFSKRAHTSRTQHGTLICLLEHDASNATIFQYYSPQMSHNLETWLRPNLTNSAFKPPAASFTLSLHFAGLMQTASPVNKCKVGCRQPTMVNYISGMHNVLSVEAMLTRMLRKRGIKWERKARVKTALKIYIRQS